jgi:predicted transcriptional regulator
MASSRVTVELDDEDRERLAEVLEKLKRGRPGEVVTVSDAVREAIRGESRRTGGIKRQS